MTSRKSTTSDVQLAAKLRYVLVRMTRTLRRDGKSRLSASQISALATLEEFGSMRVSSLATHESIDPSVATRATTIPKTSGPVSLISVTLVEKH